ncbi:MAG TPA: S1/P1 nuclease [Gemmatimonadales bacterium]|nr:S1/P1 nuclease [Gemmatimonadales bacterium]
MLTPLVLTLFSVSSATPRATLESRPDAGVWYDLGHRVVAHIAEDRLTPNTSAAIRDLLAGQDLGDAAVWADRIRGARRNTSLLHYVNIPLTATRYEPQRDCPGRRCIIAACDSFARVLADARAGRGERAEALRFLLHLIGDLHQPLHVANNDDRGGNQTQVRLGPKGTNLHDVWDGQILETRRLGEAEYLERLRSQMRSLDPGSFERGTVIDWAMEGHATARRLAYAPVTGRHIDEPYIAAGLEATDLALIKAGVRLAAVLNRALASYQPSPLPVAGLPAGTYSDAEAIAHVGETATVVGTVVSVRTSRAGNTFLNFGRDYPRQTFAVALLRPHPDVGKLVALQGKRVRVHGLIRSYKGQAEIVIEDPAQIVVMR